MKTETPNDHIWCQEQTAAYLTGGLDAGEQMRFDAHVKGCEVCKAALDAQAAADREFSNLFDSARPAEGFEDRIIQKLRTEMKPPSRWNPYILRITTGIAAVIVLGGFGYVATEIVNRDRYLSANHVSVADARSPQHEQLLDYRYATVYPAERDEMQRGLEYSAASPFVGVSKDNIYSMAGGAKETPLTNLWALDKVTNGILDEKQAAARPADESVMRKKGGATEEERLKLRGSVVPRELGDLDGAFTFISGDALGLAAGQEPAPNAQPAPPAVDTRKIIRNGEMEFEVDSFDAGFMLISKIAAEEGGFVATTSSEKLPNGKTKGVVVVRVAPDKLDVLLLKLRALGELKTQRIGAQDVTKQYTDLESQLRAARAMEDRLIEIVKTGKGEIKDLLEAEKQLGVWREKIEVLEGEIRYYNNLISLSTLSITLTEKDIKSAAAAFENENVNAGVESEDVEKSRAEAIKAIEEAKGRVIESDLKKFDAGQLAARIVADVPPDAAGGLIDRLKQLGKVARLDIERRQTAQDGNAVPPGVRVEKKETRFSISLYNLANIAPRETVSMRLAAKNVHEAHAALVDAARAAGARVLSSQLNEGEPPNVTAQLDIDIPQADRDAILRTISDQGVVFARSSVQSADLASTVESKLGIRLTLVNLDQLPPRESTRIFVDASDVENARASILAAVSSAGGRLMGSTLNKESSGTVVAQLAIDVPLASAPNILNLIQSAGTVRNVEASKNAQITENALSRARIDLTLSSGDRIVSRDSGFWASIRQGLSTSVAGLLWSLQLIVIGLCFVGPWVVILWIVWKIIRRRKRVVQ